MCVKAKGSTCEEKITDVELKGGMFLLGQCVGRVECRLEKEEGGKAVCEDGQVMDAGQTKGGLVVEGGGNATKFSSSDGVAFAVACRIDCVDSVIGKEGLVCGVEGCTRTMGDWLIRTISVVGPVGDPTEGGGRGIEEQSLVMWVREGRRRGEDRRSIVARKG